MFKSMQLIVHYFNLEIYTCTQTIVLSSSSSFSAPPPWADNGVTRIELWWFKTDSCTCYGYFLSSSIHSVTYAIVRESLGCGVERIKAFEYSSDCLWHFKLRSFSVIFPFPNRLVEMNQDNAEMDLNKFCITFDYPSRSPKANPRRNDRGGSRRESSLRQFHLKQLVLRQKISGSLKTFIPASTSALPSRLISVFIVSWNNFAEIPSHIN